MLVEITDWEFSTPEIEGEKDYTDYIGEYLDEILQDIDIIDKGYSKKRKSRRKQSAGRRI